MHFRNELHEYQRKTVRFIKEKQRCALFIGMGLGKTVSTLTAIKDLVDQNKVRRCLVIAPLNVCKTVWKQEAENWYHTAGLTVTDCTGPEKKRIEGFRTESEVYLLNRENVVWFVDACLKKKTWPFDMIVIDESTSFKSHASQRFKAMKKVLPKINYVVILTGTPAPNGLMDLWSQMYFVDCGQRLGRTITAYRNAYFIQSYDNFGYTLRPGVDKDIHNKISDVSLSLSADDYLDLPPRINLETAVELPEATLKAYKTFEKDLCLELAKETHLLAPSAAVLANKLLQFANGAVIYDTEENKWKELHSAKIDALENLIENNPQEKILVAYNYRHDLERLKNKFPEAVVLSSTKDTANTVKRWNEGKIPLMFAHPASAGHGINLQKGGHVLIWFGLTWNLEYYDQFNGRLYRQGQKDMVRIIHLVSKGTIDTKVMRALSGKSNVQDALLNALKETVQENTERN